MRDITIIDDSFDINITSSYHLSLFAHSRGTSMAIMDAVRMKFIVFRNNWFKEPLPEDQLYDKLENTIAVDGYLHHNYKKMSFCLVTPTATLIPAPMFDANDKTSFDKYLGVSDNSEMLLDSYISSLDSHILYKIPSSLYEQANNLLDSPQFFHQSHPLIENALIGSKGKTGKNKVYINVLSEFIDAVVIDNGQLLLYNSFPFRSDNDIVFYILYLFDQFKLLSENTVLEISGLVEERAPLIDLLKKHIRNVAFQEFNRSFSYSYTFNELIQHHYSNLINLFRCE